VPSRSRLCALSLVLASAGLAHASELGDRPQDTALRQLQRSWERVGESVDAALSGSWLGSDGTAPPGTPPGPVPAAPATGVATPPPPAAPAAEEEVEFDNIFMGSAQKMDLSKFARSGYIQPGLIQVEVRVNSLRMLSDKVLFEPGPDGSGRPCLSARQIVQLGIRVESTPQEDQCLAVERLAPGARYTYGPGEQVLDLIVAQAHVRSTSQKWLDPSLWDPGIPVFHSQYSLGGNDNWTDGHRTRSYFGRFDNALSAGGWQIKNSTVASQTPQGQRTQALYTYARTDLPSLKSEVRLGNFYTSGILLDTLQLQGLSLASYDEFLPENEMGYAPVIRGTAETNATVSISQNGLEILKTQVPPGPFVISDLRGAGYSGTLQVTITEANGVQKSFLAPYSAQVQMVRKGRLKYSLNVGRLHSAGLTETPTIGQMSAQYGLFSTVTVYGGLTTSPQYNSQMMGLAVSSFAGTLAYDQTHSQARFDTQTVDGRRGRISYSQVVESSRTFINISKTDNPGGNYLSVTDTVMQSAQTAPGKSGMQGQWLANISQPLGSWGDVGLSWVSSRYAQATPNNESYTVSWRKSVRGMSLNLNATRQLITPLNQSPFRSQSYAAFLSIPLEKIMGSLGVGVSSSANTVSHQAYYNQVFGEARQLNLNLSTSAIEGQRPASTGALGYQSHIGTHAIGVSTGDHYKSMNYSTSGGVAVHAGGLTWGSAVSDTMAIVHAPGAEGARVNANAGSTIDSQGYAIVPNLQPYRVNQVFIDPRGIAADVELSSTGQQTIVRSGAVARLSFATVTGRGLLLSLRRPAGMEEVPFGATVSNAQGLDVGVVGQGGRIFLRAMGDSERLLVHWGQESDESCSVDARRPAPNPGSPYDQLEAVCR
jgi:outer membrane usher protein